MTIRYISFVRKCQQVKERYNLIDVANAVLSWMPF